MVELAQILQNFVVLFLPWMESCTQQDKNIFIYSALELKENTRVAVFAHFPAEAKCSVFCTLIILPW